MRLIKFINNLLPRRIQGNDGILPLLATAGKFALTAAKSPIGQTAIATGLSKLFGGSGSSDTELQDVRTKQQKEAAKLLLQLGTTGSAAGINLGQLYGGDLGYYQQTPGELGALTGLQGLIGGQDITQARQTYQDLANTTFDPSNPTSGYAAFSRELAKAGKESSDVLNREAAITGNRFGTAIAGEKANLAADLANQRGSYLAQLYQQGRQQQLAGAQGLSNLATQQAGIQQAIAQQAAIERNLKDQQARDAYTEYKRANLENLSRIDLLQTEANRNPYLGISSIPNSPSPFSTLANSVLGSMGKSIGGDIGKNGWESIFGNFKTTTNSTPYPSGQILKSASAFNPDIGLNFGGR